MFFRHSADKLIYPLIGVLLLIFVSYRPVYHLRPDMPERFFPADAPCSPKSPVEQKIACAYWESARMDIQWRYPHAHPLPADAPPEFSINATALGPAASAPATRDLYWHHLQQVWYLPETWKEQYEWNLGWTSDVLGSVADWLRATMDRLFTIR